MTLGIIEVVPTVAEKKPAMIMFIPVAGLGPNTETATCLKDLCFSSQCVNYSAGRITFVSYVSFKEHLKQNKQEITNTIYIKTVKEKKDMDHAAQTLKHSVRL